MCVYRLLIQPLTNSTFDKLTIQACHDLQNYSAVISILSGLESAPVYRLARTWAMVTERTCSILEPLQALTATDQNYQMYRDTLRCAVPPCIPFLGRSH